MDDRAPAWALSAISIDTPRAEPYRTAGAIDAGGGAVSQAHEPAELEADSIANRVAIESADRAYFGSRLGHDFGSVRVHADSEAGWLAQGIGARAFTLGDDIYFGRGLLDPGSREGRRLLVHELIHVRQQREGRISRNRVCRDEDPGNDRAKRIAAYKEALKKSDWSRAALMLNGFNVPDIKRHIADLEQPVLRQIRDAADVVMKNWPRVVQEQIEKQLKKFESSDFDRDWIRKIAMPILLNSDATISLDHRILMVAHARLESGAASSTGQFKEPDGWNVFNIQVEAGTPNTKKVPRWEYKKKVPADQADKVDLNETIAVTSDGRTEKWKKYKKLPSGEVREFVQTWVGIPQYPDMNEAVKGYVEYLKKMHKTAYSALTDDAKGAAEFSGGIAHFGTGYGPDVGKKIQGLVTEMKPKLRQYAQERLSELTRDPTVRCEPDEENLLKQLAK